VMNSHIFGL